ncbi:heterokaryon incompatibility protein-domain-containing protein [Colletotrichum cereale]|nr:heterokaryon incompatibility protein-domain-containing protein [Colletotrichum cereale]
MSQSGTSDNPASPAKSPVYIYRPLSEGEEIRLLVLEPAVDDLQPLQGFLCHASLRETYLGNMAPQYEALSYVWGCDKKVDDLETPTGSLPITHSLRSALRRVRHPSKPLLVWADAVCINQQDNREKSAQVKMMGKIYSAADRVLVLLDDGVESHEAELQSLLLVSRVSSQELTLLRRSVTRVVGKLLDLPWFLRVWVIQEFVLARKVTFLWGSTFFDWELLRDAVTKDKLKRCVRAEASENGTNLRVPLKTMIVGKNFSLMMRLRQDHHAGFLTQFPDSTSLFAVFEDLRNALFECTFPSDHFFSILGLASDEPHELTSPNYDLPIGSTLLRFGTYFLQQGKVLEMLQGAGLGSTSEFSPSWMPAYNRSRADEGLLELDMGYNAGNEAETQVEFVIKHDVLSVRGILADEIVLLSPVLGSHGRNVAGTNDDFYDNAISSKEAFIELTEELEGGNLEHFRKSWSGGRDDCVTADAFIDLSLSPDTAHCTMLRRALLAMKPIVEPSEGLQYSTSEELLMTQIRTFVHNRKRLKHDEKTALRSVVNMTTSEIQLLTNIVLSWMSPDLGTSPTTEVSARYKNSDVKVDELLEQTSMLVNTTMGRFCRTKNGYLGHVPHRAQTGDLIYIPLGGVTPLVLRRSEERSGMFSLVGACYVDGVMEGEVVLGNEDVSDVSIY